MKTCLLVVFGALAACQVLPASAQVHRCTMPDGKVVYSDTPCPTAAASATTLVKPSARSAPGGAAPPSARVRFSGPPRVDYIKASAILDNIRVLGRDCEWALKLTARR